MNKKLKYIIFLSFLSICSYVIASEKITAQKIFSSTGLDLFNVSVLKNAAGNNVYQVSDVSYQQNQYPLITDLILSFNNISNNKYTDDSNRYYLPYSMYDSISNKGEIGKKAAFFYKQEHKVEIANKKKLWLSNSNDLGSFSIEFRFYPIKLDDGSIIFSRVGYNSGRRNGIEISFHKKHITSKFYGIFKNNRGRRIDITLAKGEKLKKNNWYHYLISYDRLSGKLTHYLNEEEMYTKYITENGEPYNGVMHPSFVNEDLPVSYIGKNYYGYLDEFRLTYRKYEDLNEITDIASRRFRELQLNGRVPINKEGIVTSPVYKFSLTGTMITLFNWQEILEKNTFIWMELRVSDARFEKKNNKLPWYKIKNNQRNIYLKKINNQFLRGKYYQWRAHLIPSPDGLFTPRLFNVKINYEIDPAPSIPMLVSVQQVSNRKIILSWKKNVDHDIYGYNIYYGVKSKNYEGIIKYYKGNLITNKINNDNYISVVIDNRIIEENRRNDKSGMLDFPVIKNNVLYFFSVSAYDSYRPGTIFNHESSHSKEVSARPVAGSDIGN